MSETSPSPPPSTDPDPAPPQPAPPRSPPPQPLGPALGAERIGSVDVLRGVAVLGILAMNIYAFAMPFAAYANPLLYGGSSGLDLATWFFTHLLFDQKFMPVFSMLFGAGLVMIFERARERGAKMTGVWYRRNLWLLAFGLAHAYLIWMGDILVAYSLLGFVIFFFRRLKPRTLLIIGIPVLCMGMPANHFLGRMFASAEREIAAIEAAREAGETLSAEQEEALEKWEVGPRAFLHPGPEDVTKDIDIHLGGYVDVLEHRVPTAFMIQVFGFLTFSLWRAGGMMLIGMALMKLGIFAARRSVRFYVIQLAVGYGLGLPLAGWSAYDLYRHEFDGIYLLEFGNHWNLVGGAAVALGHVALVMLAVKLGWLPGLVARLSAAGRMAFTNYLAHSILLTPIFYGYGLGFYGQVNRFGQMGIVLGVWALQLWWSPLWLRRFRFGPLEWLWRSLTYWKPQPFRRA